MTDKLTPEEKKEMDELFKQFSKVMHEMPDLPGVPATFEFRMWFTNLVEHVLRPASIEMIARSGSMPPVLTVFREGHQPTIVPVDKFATYEDKDRVTWFHRRIARFPGVTGVVFTSEAWTKNADLKEGQTIEDMPKDISSDPERSECVMWNCIRGREQMVAFADIIRVPPLKPTLGKPRFWDPMGEHMHVEGRMTLPKDEKEK